MKSKTVMNPKKVRNLEIYNLLVDMHQKLCDDGNDVPSSIELRFQTVMNNYNESLLKELDVFVKHDSYNKNRKGQDVQGDV